MTSICFYASSFCLICAIKIWNVPETIISLLFQVEFQGQQEFQVQQEAQAGLGLADLQEEQEREVRRALLDLLVLLDLQGPLERRVYKALPVTLGLQV